MHRIATEQQVHRRCRVARQPDNDSGNFLGITSRRGPILFQPLGHTANTRQVVRIDPGQVRGRPTRPVGQHATRLDGRHLDAEMTDFLREHFGETSDGPLRSLVSTQPWRAGAATHRRDVNNVAGPLLTHHGKRSAGDVDDTEQIGLDLRTEVRRVELLEGCNVSEAGIVDQHIETAELIERHLHSRLRRCRVGYVEGHGPHAVAVASSELAQLLRMASCCDQAVTSGKHRLGDIATQAASATGHEPDFGRDRHGRLL